MAVSISFDKLTSEMTSLGFSLERLQDERVFARTATIPNVYEHVEIILSRNDVILPSIAIAVVRSPSCRFRGLFERAGVGALATDPDNGRVSFYSSSDEDVWFGRFANAVPGLLRDLINNRAEHLLLSTQGARDAARELYADYLAPVVSSRAPAEVLRPRLSDDQAEVVARFLEKPFIIGAREHRAQYEAAVMALALAGDSIVLNVGRHTLSSADAWRPLVQRAAEVPNVTIWTIRLLVDALLAHPRHD